MSPQQTGPTIRSLVKSSAGRSFLLRRLGEQFFHNVPPLEEFQGAQWQERPL